MRVTQTYLTRSITDGLGDLTSELDKINRSISSAKRLTVPSDDPVAAVTSLSVRSQLSAMDQQKTNIQAWQGWLQSSESATSSATDVVSRARELAVQMSSGTVTASQRQGAVTEVNNLLEQMVSLGNTQYAGRYVFAGFKQDAPAFDVTKSGGEITAVTYAGDDGHAEVKLGPGSRVEASVTGRQVFQGSTDVFAQLISLRDALKADNPSAVAGCLTGLKNAGNNMTAREADIGSRMNRLDMRLSVIADVQVADTGRLSDLQDTDMVTAITDLQSKQLAYQAALKSAATIQQLSLAAYL
jgi:flagellar hook-associated protein 3 FlgL